jgi:hypothetical protein
MGVMAPKDLPISSILYVFYILQGCQSHQEKSSNQHDSGLGKLVVSKGMPNHIWKLTNTPILNTEGSCSVPCFDGGAKLLHDQISLGEIRAAIAACGADLGAMRGAQIPHINANECPPSVVT